MGAARTARTTVSTFATGPWLCRGWERPAPSHRHAHLEINLALRGRATCVVDGRRCELRPRSLLWLSPGRSHAIVRPSADFTLWVAWLEAPADGGAMFDPGPATPVGRVLTPERARELGALFAAAQRVDEPAWRGSGVAFLAQVAWRALLDGGLVAPPPAVDPLVRRALDALDRDPADGLAPLARRLGVPPARLSRRFSAALGIPLGEYRDRLRLARAMAAARRGTLLDAALGAGFGSYAQFHRAFTRMVGQSPRAWLDGARADA